MQFTLKLLKSLRDSGKDISLYSEKITDIMGKYSFKNFDNYSNRSFYHWINETRPIPLSIVLKVMKEKNINQISVEYFCVSGGNKIKFPEENDLRFCYLLGLILGDGCLVHRKRKENRNNYLMHISFAEKNRVEEIKILTKKLFDIDSKINLGNGCYVLASHSKPLVLILNKKYQIPVGIKYKDIKVPDLIIKGDKRMKKSFVKGVFDSDGNVYLHKGNKCIQLRQKSKNFVEEMQDLLRSINLDFKDPYYDKANNSWLLWTSKKSLVDSFINEIIDFNIYALVAQLD